MLIFHRDNLVMFSVPKTGTTALEGALSPRASVILRDPPFLKHMPVQTFESRFAPMVLPQGQAARVERVAMIREPIDWLGSWFRYRNRDEIVGNKNSTRGMSFEDFVGETLKPLPVAPAQVGSQSKFLRFSDGSLGIDRLFRYEAMPHYIAYLETRLRTKITTARRNVSPEMPLSLPDDLRDAVQTARSDEYDLWRNAEHV